MWCVLFLIASFTSSALKPPTGVYFSSGAGVITGTFAGAVAAEVGGVAAVAALVFEDGVPERPVLHAFGFGVEEVLGCERCWVLETRSRELEVEGGWRPSLATRDQLG